MFGKLTGPAGLALVAIMFTATPSTAGTTGASHGSLTFEKSEHVNSERGNTPAGVRQ